MKVRVRMLFVLALAFFAIGVGMFLSIYFYGEQLLPHKVVFVPKDGRVDMYTTITGKNVRALFQPEERLAAAVSPNMITLDQMETMMNKTMVMPLYPGDALTANHIRDEGIVPKPGENEYPIPTSWLEVLDWTGRPGDMAEIWLFPTDKLKQAYAQKFKMERSTPETVPETADRPLSKALYDNIRLRYVMDTASKSVRNMKEAEDRSEATGEPAKLKANLTPDQYAKLKNAVEEGYKLIVVTKGVTK